MKSFRKYKYKIQSRITNLMTTAHLKFQRKILAKDISKVLMDDQLIGMDTIPTDTTEEDIWNRFLLLPWDTTWHMVLIIFTFVTTSIHLPLLAAMALMTNQLQEVSSLVYTGEITYTVDLILYIIAIKNPYIFKPVVNSVNRPTWLLIIDVISILPLQLFVGDTPLYNKLCLIHSLKVVRFQYVLRYIEKMLFYKNSFLWLEILFWLGGTISYGTLLAVAIECQIEEQCPHDLNIVVYRVVHHIINGGYYHVPDETTWTYMKLVAGVPFIIVTIFLTIASRAHHTYRDCYKKKLFIYQYEVTKQVLDNISSSSNVTRMYNNCYETIWRMCDGYSGYLAETLLPYPPNDYNEMMPQIMWTDVTEDITRDFFLHSMLFANADRGFLRALSATIDCLVYSKGQLLYIKDELADKMVYIVSGLVQIISSDDEETSLLDMISGTCLGETCLLFPKNTVSTIRCEQDCEIQVLKSKNYFRVCKSYTNEHRVLYKTLLVRMEEAKEFKRKADFARMDQHYYMLDMMWMNHMLHKIAGAQNREQARRHELQNIHLRSSYAEEQLTNIPRMIKYLRLINIAARTLALENSVFLKTTWPYIIHPDGIMRQLLEIFILTMTLITAFVIPYTCFMCDNTIGIEIVQLLITSIWLADLWFQIHTAVKTKAGMIIEPMKILRYRLTTVDFLIDIFSCFPLEILTVLFVSMKNYPKFQLNRAAKLWRIFRMFQRWENMYHINVTIIRVIRMLCFLIYAIYISACVMYSVPCDQCNNSFLYDILPVAVQLCTGISLEFRSVEEYTGFYLPMMIFSWFTVNSCISYMIVGFKIRRVFKYEAHQKVESFMLKIPKHRKDLQKDLRDYVAIQEKHGQCVTIIFKQQFLDNLTRQQIRIICELHIGPTLRQCPLFAGLGDDNILELCSLTLWKVKPAGDFILNSGDVQNFLVIVLDGYCETVNGHTGKNLGVRTGYILNELEALLNEASCKTVVAVSACRIIMFQVLKLKRMFELFPTSQRLQPTLDACKDIKDSLRKMTKQDIPLSKFKYFTQKKTKSSFYNINENKKTRLFYLRHFMNLNSFSYIRFLLLTTTIRPNGRFILIWEIFRSICAILSTLTYIHVKFICGHPKSLEYYLLWFLDLGCYVDIYVRLHVGYYNSKGLLIQHPLFTARNYIHGPFVIDFLTTLPFRFIVFFRDKPTTLMVCHMLKVFQLYRYFMLIYIKAKSRRAKIFFFVIPACALMLNFVAKTSILIMCNIDDCKNWPKKLKCIQFSALSQKLVDDGHLYLYSIYVVTSIMTTTGLQGAHYLHQYIFFWFLNVVSLLLYAVFTGLIVSIYYSYDIDFLKYQNLISNLRNFMNREKVPSSLQSVVLDYYQRCWNIRKGQNINYLMKPFTYSLKREVLYEIFGKNILKNWALTADDSILFLKRVLLQMNELLVLPGHDILEVNDICTFIYIIVKGSVLVKNENKTIITKLTKGSIFGNLTKYKSIRIDMSFTAFDILEILYISSDKFLNYMKRFPECYGKYQLYKSDVTGLNYIAAQGVEIIAEAHLLADATSHTIRHILNKILYFLIYVSVIGTILHTMLYLYGVIVRYNSLYYMIIMYAQDTQYALMFIFLYLLEKYDLFRVRYCIFEKYHNYLTVAFCISLVPFELIAHYKFHQSSNFFYIYKSLKAIRFIRILHIVSIHNTYLHRFCQHMVLLRMLTVIILYLLMILFCTAILSLSSQLFQPNFNPQIDSQLLDSFGSFEKFAFFVRLVGYVVNSVLKITNIEHQPVSYIHTLIMIFMMVAIRLTIMIGTAELAWIIHDTNLTRMIYNNKLMDLFSFMKRWNCSQQIMERVQNYLELNWNYSEGEGAPTLFTYAPRFLKRCLASHCYLEYINNHMVFGKCPIDFQRQLVVQLKSEIHEHGQFILIAGTHNSKMYWIHRGHVLQILENDTNILGKGDCFAYQEGSREVNNSVHRASYKALTQVEIISLERSSWMYLVKHFPDAKAIIKESHEGSTADIIQNIYY